MLNYNKRETNYNVFRNGFWCGSEICISYFQWCTGNNAEEYSLSYVKYLKACPQLVRTFTSDRLCQNATFWKHRGSNRCTGNNPGQINPGPTYYRVRGRERREVPINCDDIYDDDIGESTLCRDNSDIVCDRYSDVCASNLTKFCDNNEICIHHTLECDGYIHCPDGSDEEETKCKVCPRDFGYPPDKLKVD